MDDFVISNLHESRNEWCSRLVSIFTPLITEGIRSIFNESWKLCLENDEANKYLMTFQNLLSRVPKWNNVIVEEERKRIIERSGCNYLEDLITCVHIIQLKVLTCIRVGNKQKKIDISIPKLDNFIHKVYINVARKVYTNVYLFEKPVTPLQQQRNNRELETIIQECIMIAIRESIPTEAIIRAYLDESVEQEEEVIIENIVEEAPENEEKTIDKDDNNETIRDEDEIPQVVPSIQNIDNEDVVTRLTFNDIDSVLDMETNAIKKIDAPKNLERLEEISTNRAIQRKLEEEEDDEDRIRIHGEQIDLSGFDILDEVSTPKVNQDVLLNDFEELF
jgi:predicted ester cyclase